MKCKNCNQDVWQLKRADQYYWIRCGFCGFHTSSYPRKEWAVQAKDFGEHYISENGNKIMMLPLSGET